jgi:two-component system osmolarity sensor histidine kinase EnvZ
LAGGNKTSLITLKRIFPKSLLGRALIIIVAPLVLVQLVAATVFFDRVWETLTRRLSSAVAGEIAVMIKSLDRFPDPADQQWILTQSELSTGLSAVVEEGATIADTAPDPGQGVLQRVLIMALRERVNLPFTLDLWTYPRDAAIDIQLAQGVLHVLAPRERLFTSMIYVFLAWMVGSSIVTFSIAALFMRNQVRPIRRLAQVARDFGRGRDTPEFRPAGAREVRQAAAAFLDMRDRLRRFVTQRTEMLAGVSHDLRTPITRMKLELAMLGDSQPIRDLRSDLADMERMVDSYLDFVRGEGHEQITPTRLDEILEEVAGDARRGGARIEVAAPSGLAVPVRPLAIKRCLNNLVSNALRHGEQVAIRAEPAGRAVLITIDDDGPGIPEADREAVFKPFHRLEASRNRETGGVGLGLTIARDVVRGHGGDLTLTRSPMGGLRAEIRIPA